MSLQSLFEGYSWHVFLSVWLLITTIVLALFYRPRTRKRQSRAVEQFDDRGRVFDTSAPEPAEDPSFLTEKRTSLRREGNPVIVRLSDEATSRTFTGEVLDRSTTGLKLCVPREIRAGSVLRVLAENAPDTTPWVFVQVTRAQRMGRGEWEIGCRFSQTPPWNILLLFG